MSRRSVASASLPPDAPSVTTDPAQRWHALFGTKPPAKSQALVAAAVAWAEQVALAGDVTASIQHDLAIVAHQVRVARLGKAAEPPSDPQSASCASSPPLDERTMHEMAPMRVDASPSGASCATSTFTKTGTVRQMATMRADAPRSSASCATSTLIKAGTVRQMRGARPAPAPLPPASSQLTVGTRLVKVHQGVTHVVDVTAGGMRYQGQLFASLSAVAKHITGTHWNGLLFFGLRRRKTYPGEGRGHGQG